MAEKPTSGLEKVPPILTRPLWKERLTYIFLATLAFWVIVFWLMFG